MTFNAEKFNAARFAPRETDVKVPALADFFDGDPVWRVRGLSGHEMAAVRESAEATRDIDGLVGKLLSGSVAEKAEAVREAIGGSTSNNTPEDLVRRIHMLKRGAVEPTCDHRMAVKLADAHVTVFYELTNKIISLTGQGKRLGE